MATGVHHPSEAPAAPIAEIPLSPHFGRGWTIAVAVSGVLVLLLAYSLVTLTLYGIGIWGNNIPHVWGFDLLHYAWWIGIANGASLVAAVLVTREHDLRTAVNRVAEGTALFAVLCAGIFPIVHLGKPWLFYWLFPYPATHQVWPQFRSPLTWDFWAISTHVIITSVFWYVGLIPDLATLRDKAHGLRARRIYGIFALGWRGSIRHWAIHQKVYRFLAFIAVPLLIVMQSTVALEFGSTLVPDWHETRQPLHFVLTGIASGLATFLLVSVLLRRFLALERYIQQRDIDLIARLVAVNGLIVGWLYADEIFFALLADDATRNALIARLGGTYAFSFWGAVALTAIAPQVLWLASARRGTWIMAGAALSVYLGVWLDRFSIVVGGIEFTHLRTVNTPYAPTLPEYFLFFGTVGLFTLLMLLFVRLLPVIALYEVRHDERRDPS